MTRGDYPLWLNAGLDGELDIASSLEMQAQLARDPVLKAAWDRQQAMRAAIRQGASYYQAPAGLRARLAKAAQSGDSVAEQPARVKSGPREINHGRRRWGLALGSALGSALLTWAVTWQVLNRNSRERAGMERIAEDAVAGHVRALMTDRLIDVASSDQHTVKPWLGTHLTYSPPVPDLSAQGFELLGARRDVIDGRTTATLVYRRRRHIISAYVRPATAQAEMKATSVRGFNVISAARNGMEYWVVSDLNTRELGDFAELVLEGK